MRHWVPVVVVLGLAALGVFWLHIRPSTEERTSHHVCRVCGSYRVEHESRVGDAPVQASVARRPSAAFEDLLDEEHVHDWAYEFSNTERRDGLFVEIVHGDGFPGFRGRMPNAFTTRYNSDAAFRSFVRDRLASGEFSRAMVHRIVHLENLKGDSAEAVRARAILGAHSR